MSRSTNKNSKQAHDPNFKSKICHHYQTKGACWYGDQCGFLHIKKDDIQQHLKNEYFDDDYDDEQYNAYPPQTSPARNVTKSPSLTKLP
ncbi:U-box domain-containing protein, partial [Acrasis kona]